MTEEYRISRTHRPLLTSLTLNTFPIISVPTTKCSHQNQNGCSINFLSLATRGWNLILFSSIEWSHLILWISQTPLVIPWKLSNSENVSLILTKFVLRNIWKIFQIIKSILSFQKELIQHFCWNSYSVCLARALVAPLFVQILYKTAGLAGVQSVYRASWLNANICWCLPFSADNNSAVLWCGETGRAGRKPSPNSVKLNPIMSREKRLTSES